MENIVAVAFAVAVAICLIWILLTLGIIMFSKIDEYGYRIITTELVGYERGYTTLQTIFRHPAAPAYLIPHERVHVDQQKRDGLLWYWRYNTSKEWRLKYELPAHRAAVWAGEPIETAAYELCSFYDLDLTYDQALELIQNHNS